MTAPQLSLCKALTSTTTHVCSPSPTVGSTCKRAAPSHKTSHCSSCFHKQCSDHVCSCNMNKLVRPSRSHFSSGPNDVNTGMTAVSLCTQDMRHRIMEQQTQPFLSECISIDEVHVLGMQHIHNLNTKCQERANSAQRTTQPHLEWMQANAD